MARDMVCLSKRKAGLSVSISSLGIANRIGFLIEGCSEENIQKIAKAGPSS